MIDAALAVLAGIATVVAPRLIVGVHTPEFAYERSTDNARAGPGSNVELDLERVTLRTPRGADRPAALRRSLGRSTAG